MQADVRAIAKRTLATHSVPQDVFAALVRVNAPRMSKYLAGLETFSAATELRLQIAVKFIEWVAAQCAPFPCCFHRWERIEPLWLEFKASYAGTNGDARTAETRAAIQA
jgi:hypothetical protein